MAAATQPFFNFPISPTFFFVSQRTLVKNAAALVASAAQYALNNTPVPSGPEKGLLLAQHADEEGDAGQFAWPDPTSVQDLPGEYRHGHEQQGSYCGEEHYVWLCCVYC